MSASIVGPFAEALRASTQPCTFLLLMPAMLVAAAARLSWQSVGAVVGAAILGGWLLAANTFVLDGWWLRLSALPVIAVVALVVSAGERVPGLRSPTVGAIGAGCVTLVATLWWRPCVGSELGTVLTAAQDGVSGQLLPMAVYMTGALTPVAALAVAHRVWEPPAVVTTRIAWVAAAIITVIGCSILAGQHDEVVVALTRWTAG